MRDPLSREPAGDEPAPVRPDPALVDRTLAIPVAVRDLVRAADAIDALPEAIRDSFEARSGAILRSFVEARAAAGAAEPDPLPIVVTLCAIRLRIECLAVLLGSHRLRAWTLPVGRDAKTIYIRNVILEIAATAPLRLTDRPDGSYRFDVDEFVRRLLEATPTEGKA